MADVTVRYWAGARAAAGRDTEQVDAASMAELVRRLGGRDAALAGVLARSSLLVDGRVVPPDDQGGLTDGQLVEVLPPFAGG